MALAEIGESEEQTRREYDATIPGLAALQGSIDYHEVALRQLDRQAPSRARDTERASHRRQLTAAKRRLEAALRRAADTTRDRDLPADAALTPVAGAVDMDAATRRRWQHVDMVAQARTSPGQRKYCISLIRRDGDQRTVRMDVPSDLVEVDGAPHKAQIAEVLEALAGHDRSSPVKVPADLVRQARAVLDACAISVPTRRDA